MDYKYKVGDVLYHKSSGHYGRVRKLAITDNGKKPAYKVVNIDDRTYTKWSESRVLPGEYQVSIKPSENPIDITFENIGVDDYIVIKTKEQFKSDDISFDIDGNPQVSITWDSDNIMQKFFGKSIKVTKKYNMVISAETWSWSLDCIHKIIKKDELVDTSSIYDEMDKPEEVEEKPKPKPITYKPMSVKEEIIAMMPTPILLEGSVGSGKSTILIELAKELGLRYFAMVMSDGSTVSDFKGYKNVVDGTYVATEFRDCFENGGMYVLEELNASTSNMPIIFNSIENDYFVFADKLVKAHPDFRLCATMNTITNAKDFGGRRPLDKSVKNRFHTIIVDTDFKSRFSKDIVWYQKELQKILKSKGSSQTIGSREITRFIKLVDKGMDPILATQKTLDEEGIIMKLDIENLLKRKEDYK